MKNCLICEKEISDKEELCQDCLNFMDSKYKGRYKRQLKRFRKSKRFLEKWRSSEKEVGEE